MELRQINLKITEAKVIIEKLKEHMFNENITELFLASGQLECKYNDALSSETFTYAMAADIIEIENRIDRLMVEYKSVVDCSHLGIKQTK
jgi:hypothetical protein